MNYVIVPFKISIILDMPIFFGNSSFHLLCKTQYLIVFVVAPKKKTVFFLQIFHHPLLQRVIKKEYKKTL